MTVVNYERVIEFNNDTDTTWVRSEFPHPLVTIDFDKDDNVIAVSVVVPENIIIAE